MNQGWEIDREQWDEIQTEFGQDEGPLGSPCVHLTEFGLQVEFGGGESDASVWATEKSTRIDTGDLSLYVSSDRLLLLKRLGPYPIKFYRVLYDSDAKIDHNQKAAVATIDRREMPHFTTEKAEELVLLLRLAVQGHYGGHVDETDPAVGLVKNTLRRVVLDWTKSTNLTAHAVEIVRTVRSRVPSR